MVIQKDETQKELRRKEIQSSLIKDKSEIFKKSKESSSELSQMINTLNQEIEDLTNKLTSEKQEKTVIFILLKDTVRRIKDFQASYLLLEK
ncbi:hypothetical protein [Halarcobacter anaerophilus]|uniref:hypothetical protein n=1 Tax=Halarcobacter anaerophilus TaxID=877500 RepID=UPI0005C837E1|nr:hypothetical protein [Halarcobacter anaerophilus]